MQKWNKVEPDRFLAPSHSSGGRSQVKQISLSGHDVSHSVLDVASRDTNSRSGMMHYVLEMTSISNAALRESNLRDNMTRYILEVISTSVTAVSFSALDHLIAKQASDKS